MDDQNVLTIQVARQRLGALISELTSPFEFEDQAQVERRNKAFFDEINKTLGFFAGFVFGLNKNISKKDFEEVMRAAGVQQEELEDILKLTTKVTDPDQAFPSFD
jgi:hypothetical protein